MDWTTPIDIYCERTGPDLLSEPLNFVSNASFMVGAAWIFSLMLKMKRRWPAGMWLLVSLAFLIGVGSAVFHSFATRWAQMADVIPIGVFLVYFLGYLVRVVWNFSWAKVVGILSGFGLLTYLLSLVVDAERANGSNLYFGAAASLFLIGICSRNAGHGQWKTYLIAGALFVLSLTFRTIDLAVCPAFSFGTHFLWHVLNGLVIALALKALVQEHPEK